MNTGRDASTYVAFRHAFVVRLAAFVSAFLFLGGCGASVLRYSSAMSEPVVSTVISSQALERYLLHPLGCKPAPVMNDVTVEGDLNVTQTELDNFPDFIHTRFKGSVSIVAIRATVPISFTDCTFSRPVRIEHSAFADKVKFTRCRFNQGASLLDDQFHVFQLTESQFQPLEPAAIFFPLLHLVNKATSSFRNDFSRPGDGLAGIQADASAASLLCVDCTFTQTDFSGNQAAKLEFENSIFADADFSHLRAKKCSFTRADFAAAKFTGTSCDALRFDQATFADNADLGGLTCKDGLEFNDATFARHSSFRHDRCNIVTLTTVDFQADSDWRLITRYSDPQNACLPCVSLNDVRFGPHTDLDAELIDSIRSTDDATWSSLEASLHNTGNVKAAIWVARQRNSTSAQSPEPPASRWLLSPATVIGLSLEKLLDHDTSIGFWLGIALVLMLGAVLPLFAQPQWQSSTQDRFNWYYLRRGLFYLRLAIFWIRRVFSKVVCRICAVAALVLLAAFVLTWANNHTPLDILFHH